MACLLYSRTGIEKSPYATLLDPVHWLDICEVFARDACALLGLSLESPLQVCVTAGCVALPSLLQIRQVMQQRQVTGVWTSKDELPVSELLTTTHVSYKGSIGFSAAHVHPLHLSCIVLPFFYCSSNGCWKQFQHLLNITFCWRFGYPVLIAISCI